MGIINKFVDFVNENKAYDEYISLKKWYKEEKEKIEHIRDFKKWGLKSKLLFKQYLDKKKEIFNKQNDVFALGGDIDSKYLYHYTDGQSLIDMLEENIMIASDDGISFTTHPNLYKRKFTFWHGNQYTKARDYTNIGIKMKFNFIQMKKDGYVFKKGNEDMGTYEGEEEIRLINSSLENPIKYLEEVIIFKNKEENISDVEKILNKHNIKYIIV